jgi:hypothetical protein
MNQLYATTKLGTIAELLVQLRLLECDVQAAPPIKDSGNDLIAIRGRQFRAVQVRGTTREVIDKPNERVLYDILAVVQLPLRDGRYSTSDARIYLFAQDEVATLTGKVSLYDSHLFSPDLIERFFSDHGAQH